MKIQKEEKELTKRGGLTNNIHGLRKQVLGNSGENVTGALSISGSEDVDGELALFDVGGLELVGDELEGGLVFHGAGVMRETAGQGDLLDLGFEEIGLVEEEDDSRVLEPVRVQDLGEETERLEHTDDALVFLEALVVL